MFKKLVLAATASLLCVGAAHARDQIRIVGSSTVFPYAQAAAEEYAKKTGKKAPVVESTGTGGGFKVFCAGNGEDSPDIANASRRIKASEFQACQAAGVKSITEVLIGYDGLSIAHSRKDAKEYDLTPSDLFKALAAEVPQGTKWVPNPYKTWNQIKPSLPNMPIRVFGPPPTSGTRDAFVELVMDPGCETFAIMESAKASMTKPDYEKMRKAKCSRMRQDGPFIEAGENDNLIVQRLESDSTAFGIFGYSFLSENADKLKPVAIAGVKPSEESIASFEYPVSRPLFFYVKNDHRKIVPGLDEFVKVFVSDDSIGAGGFNEERGLTPLAPAVLKKWQAAANNGFALKGL
ncbi:MAG: substrate-binding domain-containing protein [Caulobacterales bacterium]